MTDTAVTVLEIHDPRPPHSWLLDILSPSIKYGFKVRKTGTLTFALSRADVSVPGFLGKILPPEPPLVVARRPDGFLPWVGFITGYDDNEGDPFVTFYCADHTWRLAADWGARTSRNATYANMASGRIIKAIMADAEGRAEPSPFLLYDDIPDGPPGNYQTRMDYVLPALEEIAAQTNWEWGLAHGVGGGKVETHLTWQYRQGQDRRDAEVWQTQRHYTKRGYSIRYAEGIKAASVVGGPRSADFSARPVVTVSQSGVTSDANAAFKKTPVSPYGLGGTRIAVTDRVTSPAVLRQQAEQMHEAPGYAAEQLSLTLLESAIDMSRFGLGDCRTVRTPVLGTTIERVVRVMAIQFTQEAGKAGEIEVELQVMPS